MNWQCKDCSTINHIFKLDCNKCARTRINPYGLRDWICIKCNKTIFASKDKCLKCHSRRGDWKCNNCNYVNFANRQSCNKCHTDKVRDVTIPIL